jgi:hypothetical protein
MEHLSDQETLFDNGIIQFFFVVDNRPMALYNEKQL